MFKFIRAGAVVRGGHGDVDAGVGISAGGVINGGLQGDECTVLLGADFHFVRIAMADEGAGEILLAGGNPLDRAAGDEAGDPGHGLLDGDVGLVAEAAADFGDVHAHGRDRDGDRSGPGLRG